MTNEQIEELVILVPKHQQEECRLRIQLALEHSISNLRFWDAVDIDLQNLPRDVNDLCGDYLAGNLVFIEDLIPE